MLRRKILGLSLIICLITTIQAGIALAGTFERISLASTGEDGNRSSDDYAPITSNGRFVAFESDASNLVPTDNNDNTDVFLKDRLTGKVELISVSQTGESANGNSDNPTISSDGRYVAFFSWGNNLTEGDANYLPDIFLRDRLMGTTTLISKSNNGEQANEFSNNPSISEDGRYITYWSQANNLVEGLSSDSYVNNVYLYDTVTGQTSLISKDLEGNAAGGDFPSISGNGKFIVFKSRGSNLVENDINREEDFFVYEVGTEKIELISKSTTGVQANYNWTTWSSISRDGSKIAFRSYADNLVDDDTNGEVDLFVHNRLTGETQRIGISTLDQQIYSCRISGDGRYVAYTTVNHEEPTSEGYKAPDVYIVDLTDMRTEKLNIKFTGQESSVEVYYPYLSDDGRYVTFGTTASGIINNDFNDVQDIYLYDRIGKYQTPTTINYSGSEFGKRNSKVLLSAQLKTQDSNSILGGKLVNFKLGSQSLTAVTDASGKASIVVTLEQDFGIYPLEIEFKGDDYLQGSQYKGEFSITAGNSGKVPVGQKK